MLLVIHSTSRNRNQSIRTIAFVASAAPNCITKSAELVCLSPPKSMTAMAGSPPPDLYIKAAHAENEEELHVTSEKSKNAVVPEDVGLAAIDNVLPPAV